MFPEPKVNNFLCDKFRCPVLGCSDVDFVCERKDCERYGVCYYCSNNIDFKCEHCIYFKSEC
jgi:hypothetical protein